MANDTSPSDSALWDALRHVYDPEVGINIVDLGLVYRLEQIGDVIEADLTMTSPACPMGESIACEAEAALIACVPRNYQVQLQLVWEPPWTPARMSERARAELGWGA